MTLLIVLEFGAFERSPIRPEFGSEVRRGQGQLGAPRNYIEIRMFQIIAGTADRAELSEQADLWVGHGSVLSD
jgi:hypothetical protein